GHLRVGVHADAAHDVVRRGADLHRFLRDVDPRELQELVVHAGQLLLDALLGVGEPLADPGDVEVDAAVGAAPPGLQLADDAARHVIPGQQLRRAAGALAPLRVAPALLVVVRRLGLVGLGDVVVHETAAVLVQQDAALPPHALGDQDALDARRPD